MVEGNGQSEAEPLDSTFSPFYYLRPTFGVMIVRGDRSTPEDLHNNVDPS